MEKELAVHCGTGRLRLSRAPGGGHVRHVRRERCGRGRRGCAHRPAARDGCGHGPGAGVRVLNRSRRANRSFPARRRGRTAPCPAFRKSLQQTAPRARWFGGTAAGACTANPRTSATRPRGGGGLCVAPERNPALARTVEAGPGFGTTWTCLLRRTERRPLRAVTTLRSLARPLCVRAGWT